MKLIKLHLCLLIIQSEVSYLDDFYYQSEQNMPFSSIDQIELVLRVKKQSDTGLFKNQRLLAIKSGYISYYSRIPKEFVGNSRSLEIIGEIPKYTLSAENITSIKYDYPVLEIVFLKSELIDRDHFQKIISSHLEPQRNSRQNIETNCWRFKNKEFDLAQAFVEQVKSCMKPQQQKINDNKTQNESYPQRASLKPSFKMVSEAFSHAQQERQSKQVHQIINERASQYFSSSQIQNQLKKRSSQMNAAKITKNKELLNPKPKKKKTWIVQDQLTSQSSSIVKAIKIPGSYQIKINELSQQKFSSKPVVNDRSLEKTENKQYESNLGKKIQQKKIITVSIEQDKGKTIDEHKKDVQVGQKTQYKEDKLKKKVENKEHCDQNRQKQLQKQVEFIIINQQQKNSAIIQNLQDSNEKEQNRLDLHQIKLNNQIKNEEDSILTKKQQKEEDQERQLEISVSIPSALSQQNSSQIKESNHPDFKVAQTFAQNQYSQHLSPHENLAIEHNNRFTFQPQKMAVQRQDFEISDIEEQKQIKQRISQENQKQRNLNNSSIQIQKIDDIKQPEISLDQSQITNLDIIQSQKQHQVPKIIISQNIDQPKDSSISKQKESQEASQSQKHFSLIRIKSLSRVKLLKFTNVSTVQQPVKLQSCKGESANKTKEAEVGKNGLKNQIVRSFVENIQTLDYNNSSKVKQNNQSKESSNRFESVKQILIDMNEFETEQNSNLRYAQGRENKKYLHHKKSFIMSTDFINYASLLSEDKSDMPFTTNILERDFIFGNYYSRLYNKFLFYKFLSQKIHHSSCNNLKPQSEQNQANQSQSFILPNLFYLRYKSYQGMIIENLENLSQPQLNLKIPIHLSSIQNQFLNLFSTNESYQKQKQNLYKSQLDVYKSQQSEYETLIEFMSKYDIFVLKNSSHSINPKHLSFFLLVQQKNVKQLKTNLSLSTFNHTQSKFKHTQPKSIQSNQNFSEEPSISNFSQNRNSKSSNNKVLVHHSSKKTSLQQDIDFGIKLKQILSPYSFFQSFQSLVFIQKLCVEQLCLYLKNENSNRNSFKVFSQSINLIQKIIKAVHSRGQVKKLHLEELTIKELPSSSQEKGTISLVFEEMVLIVLKRLLGIKMIKNQKDVSYDQTLDVKKQISSIKQTQNLQQLWIYDVELEQISSNLQPFVKKINQTYQGEEIKKKASNQSEKERNLSQKQKQIQNDKTNEFEPNLISNSKNTKRRKEKSLQDLQFPNQLSLFSHLIGQISFVNNNQQNPFPIHQKGSGMEQQQKLEQIKLGQSIFGYTESTLLSIRKLEDFYQQNKFKQSNGQWTLSDVLMFLNQNCLILSFYLASEKYFSQSFFQKDFQTKNQPGSTDSINSKKFFSKCKVEIDSFLKQLNKKQTQIRKVFKKSAISHSSFLQIVKLFQFVASVIIQFYQLKQSLQLPQNLREAKNQISLQRKQIQLALSQVQLIQNIINSLSSQYHQFFSQKFVDAKSNFILYAHPTKYRLKIHLLQLRIHQSKQLTKSSFCLQNTLQLLILTITKRDQNQIIKALNLFLQFWKNNMIKDSKMIQTFAYFSQSQSILSNNLAIKQKIVTFLNEEITTEDKIKYLRQYPQLKVYYN